jgi:predicted glycosyltransferase
MPGSRAAYDHPMIRAPKAGVPAVLFQAPNSVGLGHINRLAAIALALREMQPATAIAFAIEGADHGLLRSLDLPWVSLPSVVQLVEGHEWRQWPLDSRDRLLRSNAESVLSGLKPTAIVFDLLPQIAFFTIAQRRKIPYCFVARKAKSQEFFGGRLKSVLNHATAIIVPHLREEFSLPRQWDNKAHYVGTIVRPRRRSSGDEMPIGGLPEPRIVITGGGGGYQGTAAFYNLAIEACRQCRTSFPTLSTVLVAGPLFAEWSDLRLNDTVLIPQHWDMAGLFEDAALIICQAGYNTVAEVLRSGKPAISVPAERGFDDQTDRACQVASRHSRFNVLQNPSAEALSARIAAVLREPASGPAAEAAAPSSDGAMNAAQVVADLIDAARRTADDAGTIPVLPAR